MWYSINLDTFVYLHVDPKPLTPPLPTSQPYINEPLYLHYPIQASNLTLPQIYITYKLIPAPTFTQTPNFTLYPPYIRKPVILPLPSHFQFQ